MLLIFLESLVFALCELFPDFFLVPILRRLTVISTWTLRLACGRGSTVADAIYKKSAMFLKESSSIIGH